MERLVLALVLGALAAVVALVAARRDRRRQEPVRTGFVVPDQLDRADFVRPGAPWLVAVFSSATCDACAGVIERARPLDSAEVAFQEVEVGLRADLHRRYGIDGVPTTVIADARGAVRAHFLGPMTAAELWATVAELRDLAPPPG